MGHGALCMGARLLVRRYLGYILHKEVNPMAASSKVLLDQALKLPPNVRAAQVENLIPSLDKPDPILDAQDAEQVFADLGKRI